MRRRPLLALSLPLASIACVLGHTAGYLLAGHDDDGAQHGYLVHLPLVLGVLGGAVLVSLGARACGGLRGRLAAWPFALVGPVAFVVQETSERLVGGVSLTGLADAAVLIGVAAQLPLAYLALRIGRALLAVADAIRSVLTRAGATRLRAPIRATAVAAILVPRPAVSHAGFGRAPPCRRA
jgi:hypothetical protein